MMTMYFRRYTSLWTYGSAALIAGSVLAGVAYFGNPSSTSDVQQSITPTPVAVRESTAPAVVAAPAAPVAAVARSKIDELGRHASFSKEWLAGHGFSPGSEALDRLHRLLDGRVNPQQERSGQEKPVMLAFGPVAGAVPGDGAESIALAQQERFIRARLPFTAAGSGDSVIVRWRSLRDDAVLELSVQPLSFDVAESPEVWMHRTADWSVGHYRVEVLSASRDLRLLASGEFEVVPDGASVTPFLVAVSTVSRP